MAQHPQQQMEGLLSAALHIGLVAEGALMAPQTLAAQLLEVREALDYLLAVEVVVLEITLLQVP
jgi:hypothetical protein